MLSSTGNGRPVFPFGKRPCMRQRTRQHPEVRMVLDMIRRLSKAMRLLQDQRAVKGEKDRMRRYVWRLVG